ncbi:hypothetical protein [Rhodopseudomonas sp. AAP120]|uniref:hypothetical protein n=1 Tax=Rhodopseudomonas sp. AAP120 TaxID=1523430 RepID=UPI0018D0D019|nr:hypothetical protein [Rhodopseudomonas sp. AAP120]
MAPLSDTFEAGGEGFLFQDISMPGFVIGGNEAADAGNISLISLTITWRGIKALGASHDRHLLGFNQQLSFTASATAEGARC